MSELLEWLYADKAIDSNVLLSVKPKPIPEGENVNEDIIIDEIDRGEFCPTCNRLVPGLPCSDKDCPW